MLYDRDDRLVLCNQRYKEIYAETAELLIPGNSFADIIRFGVENGQYPAAIGNEEAFIAERLARHRETDGAIEQELPNDRWLRIEERRTREGGYVGFRVDITQLKRQQRELTRLAWSDSLTGVLNRRRFLDLAEIEMKRAKRGKAKTALILMDIDHFKVINDTHGHAAGDAVLCELVERWKSELREYDLLARIGGEEFAVLLPDCEVEGAVAVMNRLLKKTAQPPVLHMQEKISSTISAGLVFIKDNETSLDTALARADAALYRAKEKGRNCFVLQAA